MDPLLSQYMATRSTMLRTTPSSVMNFLIQIASDIKKYSILVVESIIAFCLELFQLTTSPFRVKKYPE
jgi:hypothetical protein